MDILHFFLDLLLHTKDTVIKLVEEYQGTTYLILCLIVFCETGLVATPFLPGDSLLFTAGMVAANSPVLNVWLLIALLFASAIMGDNLNYFIGRKFGEKVFEIPLLKKIIKREYLEKTHVFYEKHGGKAIIIARFMPIVRTFSPFAAGLGSMEYKKYISFCLMGGILWVGLITLAGYYFGNIEWVQKNFEKVVFGIIGISVLPIFIGLIRGKNTK